MTKTPFYSLLLAEVKKKRENGIWESGKKDGEGPFRHAKLEGPLLRDKASMHAEKELLKNGVFRLRGGCGGKKVLFFMEREPLSERNAQKNRRPHQRRAGLHARRAKLMAPSPVEARDSQLHEGERAFFQAFVVRSCALPGQPGIFFADRYAAGGTTGIPGDSAVPIREVHTMTKKIRGTTKKFRAPQASAFLLFAAASQAAAAE